MPEEFFFILLELTGCVVFGLPPALTNYLLLKMIFKNKFAHTENPDDVAGDDFHTGHHRHHVKNFGHNCLLDMLFSTCESNNSYRMMISKSVYQVVKKEEEKIILFCFTKLSSTQTSEPFLNTLPAKNISKSTFRTKEDSMSGCWQNNIVLGRNIRKKPDHEI